MSSKRKLPILVDQAVGSVQAESTAKAQAFERLIRKKSQPTCAPGCSNCCHLPIETSVLEAIPMYRFLVQRGRWTPDLRQRLQAHANTTTSLAPSVWMLTRIPCPMLKDNRCGVYDVRPFHCRSMWATGDPFYCDPQSFGPETTLVAKDELMESFWRHEKLMAQQVGMPYFRMPISRALLTAEQIVQGSLSVRDIAHSLFLETP